MYIQHTYKQIYTVIQILVNNITYSSLCEYWLIVSPWLDVLSLSVTKHTFKAAQKQCLTVNGERFTGLNFRVFHGFQEYRESFSVNIYLYYTSFIWWRCLSVLNVRLRESFPANKFHWVESMKVYPNESFSVYGIQPLLHSWFIMLHVIL